MPGNDINHPLYEQQFFQIDIIKTICIICVIAIHAMGWLFLLDSLWQIIQPVPLFFIILGFNRANSFKRKGLHKINELYNLSYFKTMFMRFVFPLILLNVFCFAIDIIFVLFSGYHVAGWSNTTMSMISWGTSSIPSTPVNIFYFIMGAPYFPGPGSFFVLILIQFIFIFPVIYRIFEKNSLLGLITCLLIDLIFQIAAPHISFFDNNHFFFCGNILRYFSVIGLGVWFTYNIDLFSKKNIFVIVLAAPAFFILLTHYWGSFIIPESIIDSSGFAFLFKEDGTGFSLRFLRTYPWWGKANPLTYCFPGFLFLAAMKIFPQKLIVKNKFTEIISRVFKKISKLTYHIFLVQIAWFFMYIPLGSGMAVSANDFLFYTMIRPVTVQYGIDFSWQFNSALLGWDTALLVMLVKLLIVIINFIIIYFLATGLKKLESKIKSVFLKTGRS